MTNDENRSAEEALAEEGVDAASSPSPDADQAPPSSAEDDAGGVGEDGAQPSLRETWEAFSSPAQPAEIHNAVSDALADALSGAGVEPSSSQSGEAVLPPPPDRSGASFAAYDEAKDEGPEFFRETVADETLGSSTDWRARLGTAIEVADLDDEDEEDDLDFPEAVSNTDLSVHDDDDEDELPPPSSARMVALPEVSAALHEDGEREADDELDEGPPILALGDAEEDPELVEEEIVDEHANLSGDAWVKRWTSEMQAIPDDEEALRAMVAEAEAEREAAAAEEPEPAASSSTLSMSGEIVEFDGNASSSQISLSGELVVDDDDVSGAEASTSGGSLGLVVDDDEDDDDDDEGAASLAGADHDIPSPRPRELWISDQNDDPADFYSDPFPLDRWQESSNLIDYVVRGLYRLKASIGRGDSFKVFLADRTDAEGEVVIKLLGPDYPPMEERAELFRGEARIMAQLGDARGVEIVDVGTTRDGLSYIAMEKLEGPSLRELLERDGPMPWIRASAIVRQVLAVTKTLHAEGHSQRTIHPENIYVVGEGEGEPVVRLTNVGLTPLVTHYRRSDGNLAVTPEGLLGSAEYMAPEVVSGNLPGVQTDVYAAGVLLYELLAGSPPFVGESLMGLLKKHLYEAPESLRGTVYAAEIPDGIEAVLLKALEKDPAMRHGGIELLVEELDLAEKRQKELARAKSLLSAVDASLWGDDEESLVDIVEKQPVANRQTLHEVPIAPLTDEDMSVEERAAKDEETAAVAAAAAEAAAAEAVPPPVAAPSEDDGGLVRTMSMVVGAAALLVILFVLIRPGGNQATTKTTGGGSGETPVAASAGGASAGSVAGASAGTSRPDPTLGAPDPSAGTPDPSEGVPLDPSEGAPLDPSEGVPLDPSEGAPLDPSEGGDPSEGIDPSEGVDPSAGDGAGETGTPPEEAEPEAKPEDKPEDKPEAKPVKKTPNALSEGAIRTKLNGVRSRVKKKCGQANGLFAPVGLTVKVRVQVDGDGKAKATNLGSSAALGRCVVGIVEKVRFPKSRDGGTLVHTFKI